MKRLLIAGAMFAAAGVMLFLYAWQIEPRRLHVTRIGLPPALAEALRGERLVFISDLHITKNWPLRVKLLDLLHRLDPDYLFIGGDLVYYDRDVGPVVDYLKLLSARRGAFAVLGDADYRGRVRNCAYCHVPGTRELRHDIPVHILRNEAAPLAGGKARVIGLDTDHGGDWKIEAASQLSDPTPAVVLIHFPRKTDFIAQFGASLVLAADTHGGQVAAPDWFFEWFAKHDVLPYRHGWYDVAGTPLFVSRGVGESILPIRFGEVPEVVLMEGRP
jgi:uncharacterized protein